MSPTNTSSETMPAKWDAQQMPRLDGKTAIVTGGNSGIGYVTALELARHGAHVILACRSESRGKDAMRKMQADLDQSSNEDGPVGTLTLLRLDLSDLSTVRAFAASVREAYEVIDLLVNNGGISLGPYEKTVDGIECQLATNHLGHFVLTSELFPLLLKSPDCRIVNVSSLAHRFGKISLNEAKGVMLSEDEYDAGDAYCLSKLCNVLFTMELDRRLKAEGITHIHSIACHPGYTMTNIMSRAGTETSFWGRMNFRFLTFMEQLGQSVEKGALPTLYAATGPTAKGSHFYGPRGFLTMWGHPTLEEPAAHAKSEELGAKLWAESEKLSNQSFTIAKPAPAA